jgi:hypothetical protein
VIEQQHLWTVTCDCADCGVPGPTGENREEVISEAELVGWLIAYDAVTGGFNLCICPACSEHGIMPDVRVGLADTHEMDLGRIDVIVPPGDRVRIAGGSWAEPL